jgi:hypothetical protein
MEHFLNVISARTSLKSVTWREKDCQNH